jgi:hypothetical protein
MARYLLVRIGSLMVSIVLATMIVTEESSARWKPIQQAHTPTSMPCAVPSPRSAR